MLWAVILGAIAFGAVAVAAAVVVAGRLEAWWLGPDRRSAALRFAWQAALFCWFAYWTYRAVGDNFLPNHQETIGIDGRLYYRAAQTWLSGGDPWTAYTQTNTWPPGPQLVTFFFTGPPPTVLAFAPFTVFPEALFVPAWLGLTVAAAVYTLRRLSLPIWWLLFPPLAAGIVVGNPQVVCLALLLSGSNVLRALAVPMKAYAVFPLFGEGRWRALAILVIAGGISLVAFWPLWSQYVTDYRAIQDWLVGATHGGFSATRDPRLFAITAAAIVALAVIDRRAAGWLAVPAIWPAAQFYYATFALPVITPVFAAILAVGSHRPDAVVPWAIVAYSAWRIAARLRSGGLRTLTRGYHSDRPLNLPERS
jgi:hypothetical protein